MEWGCGAGGVGSVERASHESLALQKSVSADRESGQDDFGKSCVVLAVQTFPFLLAASS